MVLRRPRWVDDVTVFVRDSEHFREAHDAALAQLAINGQHLNAEKTEFTDSGAGLEIFELSGGSGAHHGAKSISELRESDPPGEARQALRSANGRSAIEDLRRRPWLIERFPRLVANAVARCTDDDCAWDWALDYLLSPTTTANGLTQLWLARRLPRSVISAAVSDALRDKGLSLTGRMFAPLTNQLFATAARCPSASRSHRDHALELAKELREFDKRRCLVAVFRNGDASRLQAAGIRDLARDDRDLDAACAWVLAT